MEKNQYLKNLLSYISGEVQAVTSAQTKSHLFCTTEGELVDAVIAISYEDCVRHKFRKQYLAHTGIVAPRDDEVEEINKRMASLFPEEEQIYLR